MCVRLSLSLSLSLYLSLSLPCPLSPSPLPTCLPLFLSHMYVCVCVIYGMSYDACSTQTVIHPVLCQERQLQEGEPGHAVRDRSAHTALPCAVRLGAGRVDQCGDRAGFCPWCQRLQDADRPSQDWRRTENCWLVDS